MNNRPTTHAPRHSLTSHRDEVGTSFNVCHVTTRVIRALQPVSHRHLKVLDQNGSRSLYMGDGHPPGRFYPDVPTLVFECLGRFTPGQYQHRNFYCSANAIFGRIGRICSEEVLLQLINSKCLPMLIYGMEVCPLGKSDLRALDFVVNRFFMKLVQTGNIEVVRLAQRMFGFVLPSLLIEKRSNKFYMVK